jgi:A/G-specific adenine glycosylase
MAHMKTFQQLVLTWFDQYGRKNLPWQQNKTAYRVWVSEIMLQQTQVTTVIPYFETFMQQFPDVSALANAHIDEVLHIWTGLGYYSRARNLHRAANMIVEEFNGELPNNVDDLQTLTGIGRSTAGAILTLAYNKQAAILDGNVKRVLTRHFAVEGWPGENKVAKQLWEIAENLTPTKRVADYTQVMMDLGATVCTRSKPKCHLCPLKQTCLAFQHNRQAELPYKKPKKELPERAVFMLLLQHNNEVLLEKRPNVGIWGGLWSLPECQSLEDAQAIAQEKYACTAGKPLALPSFRHTFSHFHLDITPVLLSVKKISPELMEAEQIIWYNSEKQQAIGLPQPVKKLLANYDKHCALQQTE